MVSNDLYNNELMDIASKVEKLKYEIIHGYHIDETSIEKLREEIVNIQELIINNPCNQLCLTELTDEEKENIINKLN